jgi:hypothetical protein
MGSLDEFELSCETCPEMLEATDHFLHSLAEGIEKRIKKGHRL